MTNTAEALNHSELYTGEALLDGMSQLARLHSEHSRLNSQVVVDTQGVAATDYVSNDMLAAAGVDILAMTVQSIKLAEERDALRQRLIEELSGRHVSVEVINPDIMPIEVYEYMRYTPTSSEMNGMSLDRNTRDSVSGHITNLFFDGSFRLDPQRSFLKKARKFALFGLGPSIDWVDAFRVHSFDDAGNPVVDITIR